MSTINPNIDHFISKRDGSIRSLDYYLDGIIKRQDFLILAEAITLLESEIEEHVDLANKVLQGCYAHRVQSRRIGVTGTPGVGKSSFIESTTDQLMNHGGRAAVLTIDPTSIDRRGSILGDKTRMTTLAQDDRIFIRPSPSRLHLGGAHEYTHEAICMCEAAGIETIIIETVGVGQSEAEIRGLVDCTMLLLLPGAGDELQGIKKGITEIADIVIIHKADGDRIRLAKRIQKDYQQASHLSKGNQNGWVVPVLRYSSETKEGLDEVVKAVDDYFGHISDGLLDQKRKEQDQKWLNKRLYQDCMEKLKNKLESYTALLIDTTDGGSPFELIDDVRRSVEIDIKRT